MTDTRPRVHADKPVNLAQLDAEMGNPGLSANEKTGDVVANGDVTQQQLEAAVAAHVAEPEPDPDADFRAAVEAASSVADLKAALLGTRGPGAQARRPT